MKTKSADIREQLILEYVNLVNLVAGRMGMYLGYTVEYDDLVGYGIFGLIDAIDKFNLEKNVKFETYDSLRIRGSILDQIRKMDLIPRTLRQRQRQIITHGAESLEVIAKRHEQKIGHRKIIALLIDCKQKKRNRRESINRKNKQIILKTGYSVNDFHEQIKTRFRRHIRIGVDKVHELYIFGVIISYILPACGQRKEYEKNRKKADSVAHLLSRHPIRL